jgi:uracil-DNA glycosylase
MNPGQLPTSWRRVLEPEFEKPYFLALRDYVARERAEHKVFPPEKDVFNAFRLTPYEELRVLLLGQDPYHDEGQAHGLAFSVRPGVRPPPSLVNIFKELHADVGCPIPRDGDLEPWAEQGVMLLNTVLTVRAHEPNSHRGHGWEQFTDAVVDAVNRREKPAVFVLWGAYAQKKGMQVARRKHAVLSGAHPSPLSAKKFFGTKPFSKINAALKEFGEGEIDWCL